MLGRVRVALLIGVLWAAGGSLVAAGPAAASGPDLTWIKGRGYGDGIGYNMYGAYEAARQGLDYRRILSFYFPHTKIADVGGSVSVRMSADNDGELEIEDRAGLQLVSLSTGQSWPLAVDGAEHWKVRAVDGGASSELSVLTDAWYDVQKVPGEVAFSAGGATMDLVRPDGLVHEVHGTLRSVGDAHRLTVNVVSLENYVAGVTESMHQYTELAADDRANAVLARTMAVVRRAQPVSSLYQVDDHSRCRPRVNVYNLQCLDYYPPGQVQERAATVATDHQVLTYRGRAANVRYTLSNGGYSVAGGEPYLPAKADPYDYSNTNPYRGWVLQFEASYLERQYPQIGDFQRFRVTSRDGNGAYGGRVRRWQIVGSRGAVTLRGKDLGGRSTLFAPMTHRPY